MALPKVSAVLDKYFHDSAFTMFIILKKNLPQRQIREVFKCV